jgi:hypothetical protein
MERNRLIYNNEQMDAFCRWIERCQFEASLPPVFWVRWQMYLVMRKVEWLGMIDGWKHLPFETRLKRALSRSKITMEQFRQAVKDEENRQNRMIQELPMCCPHYVRGTEVTP